MPENAFRPDGPPGRTLKPQMAQITLRIPRGSNYTALVTLVDCQESMRLHGRRVSIRID